MKSKTGFTHESQNAITTSWYTPSWIFQELGIEFDIDVCTKEGGVPWIPSKKNYSLPSNGLDLPWEGKVWCNPPYGKETPLWLDKFCTHKNGIALVFSRTDTKWFHEYVAKADVILFLQKRLKFVDGLSKTEGSGNTCGSLLLSFGDECNEAVFKLKDKGFIVDNRKYAVCK